MNRASTDNAALLYAADWNFWPDGLDDEAIVGVTAALGLDGLELGVYEPDRELAGDRMARLDRLARRYGVAVRMLLFSLPAGRWPGGAFTSAAGAPRARRALRRVGEVAADRGHDLVGVWPGADPGAAAARAVIAEALAAAAADLEPLGVRLAVEPKPGTAVPTALDLAAICDAGGSRNLGILVDTGHELAAGTDLDTLPGLLGERVLHVHAGDADGDDPDADLPAGRVHDLGPFLRGLAARGYRGAVTPDCYGAVSAGLCTGERATRETRDHVRAATASA